MFADLAWCALRGTGRDRPSEPNFWDPEVRYNDDAHHGLGPSSSHSPHGGSSTSSASPTGSKSGGKEFDAPEVERLDSALKKSEMHQDFRCGSKQHYL